MRQAAFARWQRSYHARHPAHSEQRTETPHSVMQFIAREHLVRMHATRRSGRRGEHGMHDRRSMISVLLLIMPLCSAVGGPNSLKRRNALAASANNTVCGRACRNDKARLKVAQQQAAAVRDEIAEYEVRLGNVLAEDQEATMPCDAAVRTMYSTVRSPTPAGYTSWLRTACPWEETRHSVNKRSSINAAHIQDDALTSRFDAVCSGLHP
jgi:hypothetical protein